MSNTSRCLVRSLYRFLCCWPSISLAVLTSGLSLPSFGGGVKVFYFNEGHQTFTAVSQGNLSPDEFATPFLNNKFGFVVHVAPFYLTSPVLDSSTITNRYGDINHPIWLGDTATPNPTTVWVAVSSFPSVKNLFSFAASVVQSGYNGPGLYYLGQASGNAYYNFDFKSVSGEILCSTNYVLRSILLSYLSNIQSSVHNIDVNVSGLQSTIQQGNDDIIDALIGDYPELQEELRKGNSRAVDVRSSIKSQLQAWRNQATQQLQDWKSDLKSDLQDWKTSDETGYLNVRQSVNDVTAAVDSLKNQFSTFDPRIGTNLHYTAFVTNFVTAPVTNSVRSGANQISTNIISGIESIISDAASRYEDFMKYAVGDYGTGLRVHIVQPTDGDNHVLVKDDAVLRVLEEGVTFVNPELTQISDAWDSFLASYSPTNSLDWQPWFDKWVPFSDVVTNYYAEFNESVPASEVAADFLERGFDSERYSSLPWFERVEVLLAMIADVRSNSVEVADIQEDMEEQVTNFQALSTNVVFVSSDVVGLFQYVQRFSSSLQSVFGDSAAPLTGDYVLLSAGHWIGDTPLVLRVNPTIQSFCRLIMQCIWYLGFLVVLWLVVNWVWSKVVAVLRWLWSMFDV